MTFRGQTFSWTSMIGNRQGKKGDFPRPGGMGVFSGTESAGKQRVCTFGNNYGEAGAIDFLRYCSNRLNVRVNAYIMSPHYATLYSRLGLRSMGFPSFPVQHSACHDAGLQVASATVKPGDRDRWDKTPHCRGCECPREKEKRLSSPKESNAVIFYLCSNFNRLP